MKCGVPSTSECGACAACEIVVLQVQVTIFLIQLLNLYLLLLVNVVLELLECGSQTSREYGAGGECEALTADESGSQINTECGVRYCCKNSACKCGTLI